MTRFAESEPDAAARILIADDHPLVRRGLRQTIQEDSSLRVVGEAEDGEAAVSAAMSLRPDLILLDIDMPKRSGLEVVRELAESGLQSKVLFLTFHADYEFFRAAIALGARGYLLKESAVDEVVSGIHAVLSGRLYISSALTEIMLQEGGDVSGVSGHQNAQGYLHKLTTTERKIMQLVADGKTSKEIGNELSIHYRTVENHRTNMCRKLDLDGEGANALLRFALQNRQLR